MALSAGAASRSCVLGVMRARMPRRRLFLASMFAIWNLVFVQLFVYSRASLEVVLTSFHLLLSYATWLCVFAVWVSMFAIWILDFPLHFVYNLFI